MKLSFGLALALLGALSSAHAAPVLYNIQFTATSGVAPTSGSFRYDPDASVFSDFFVVWAGTTFDMTAAANNPLFAWGACDTAGNGAADTFDFLLNQNCGSGQNFNGWVGLPSQFKFQRTDDGTTPVDQIYIVRSGSTRPGTNAADGTFSISLAETPVPEPAPLSLLTAAAALLAARLRIGRSVHAGTASRKRAR